MTASSCASAVTRPASAVRSVVNVVMRPGSPSELPAGLGCNLGQFLGWDLPPEPRPRSPAPAREREENEHVTDIASTWKATYAQYGIEHEHEADTLREALGYLWYGEMEGKLASHEVIAPDGSVYLNRKQVIEIIYREFCDHGDWSAETSPTIAALSSESP